MKHYIRAWSKEKHGLSYYKSKKLKNKYNRRYWKLSNYAKKTYPWCNYHGKSIQIIEDGVYGISSCYSTEDFKGLNPRNKVKDIDTMLKLVRKNTKFKNST